MDSVNTFATQWIAPKALVMDLLAWIAAKPRTYAETMEAWQTSCPRLPVWEDAIGSALVVIVGGGSRSRTVSLTLRGRALLEGHAT